MALLPVCAPTLPRGSAVALTPRAAGGLTTRQIATAYLVPESTIALGIPPAVVQTVGEDQPGQAAARGAAARNPAMAGKLIESAQARWRAVNAPHLVALVRVGARFENRQNGRTSIGVRWFPRACDPRLWSKLACELDKPRP